MLSICLNTELFEPLASRSRSHCGSDPRVSLPERGQMHAKRAISSSSTTAFGNGLHCISNGSVLNIMSQYSPDLLLGF